MPEKMREGDTVMLATADVVLERESLAAQIGNICSNWALIEEDLMVIYSLLLGLYIPPEPDPTPHVHPVGFVVFDNIDSLRARLDLIVAQMALTFPKEKEQFEKDMIPRIRARYGERSEVAHGLWTRSQNYPDALILKPIIGPNLVYRKHDFVQISTRLRELHLALRDFITPIFERIRRHNELSRPKSQQPDEPQTPQEA